MQGGWRGGQKEPTVLLCPIIADVAVFIRNPNVISSSALLKALLRQPIA